MKLPLKVLFGSNEKIVVEDVIDVIEGVSTQYQGSRTLYIRSSTIVDDIEPFIAAKSSEFNEITVKDSNDDIVKIFKGFENIVDIKNSIMGNSMQFTITLNDVDLGSDS